jgi:fructuronate reductase
MGVLTALLHRRYKAGARPIACVSMDNCSHNGEKLKAGVLAFAGAWAKEGHVEAGFIDYLNDPAKVSFPWSMIDKITPRPAESVRAMLEGDGIEGMEPIVTDKGTYTAAFVNAERPQYLVIEDDFPNGRLPLEKAGAYLTDRETVNRVERMKVTTCLNPLHTAMSVYGCLLGYTLIADEMKDADIVWLVKRLGYAEGLPVVTNPGIIEPKAFIDEVVNERLPNPFMPDDPRRIATDTSQKVGIRFGETVKGYIENGLDLGDLVALPLAIAGWFRYLLGDEVSPDPRREELQAKLREGRQREILADESVFGLDLTKTPLGEKIEAMLAELCAGPDAVRKVLHKYAGI